jgi:hypothetical protein
MRKRLILVTGVLLNIMYMVAHPPSDTEQEFDLIAELNSMPMQQAITMADYLIELKTRLLTNEELCTILINDDIEQKNQTITYFLHNLFQISHCFPHDGLPVVKKDTTLAKKIYDLLIMEKTYDEFYKKINHFGDQAILWLKEKQPDSIKVKDPLKKRDPTIICWDNKKQSKISLDEDITTYAEQYLLGGDVDKLTVCSTLYPGDEQSCQTCQYRVLTHAVFLTLSQAKREDWHVDYYQKKNKGDSKAAKQYKNCAETRRALVQRIMKNHTQQEQLKTFKEMIQYYDGFHNYRKPEPHKAFDLSEELSSVALEEKLIILSKLTCMNPYPRLATRYHVCRDRFPDNAYEQEQCMAPILEKIVVDNIFCYADPSNNHYHEFYKNLIEYLATIWTVQEKTAFLLKVLQEAELLKEKMLRELELKRKSSEYRIS